MLDKAQHHQHHYCHHHHHLSHRVQDVDLVWTPQAGRSTSQLTCCKQKRALGVINLRRSTKLTTLASVDASRRKNWPDHALFRHGLSSIVMTFYDQSTYGYQRWSLYLYTRVFALRFACNIRWCSLYAATKRRKLDRCKWKNNVKSRVISRD